MKKFLRLFASMKMALLLLLLIVLACVLGGLIPQGAETRQYEALYGKTLASFVQKSQLHHIFSAWWFLMLTGLLLINLCLCSLIRFPAVLLHYRSGFTLKERQLYKDEQFSYSLTKEQSQAFFKKMGFSHVKKIEDEGGTWHYARRRCLGIWGSWLSHLGMLVIVVGFSLGQLLLFETSVYGVPGQTLCVPGSELAVTIEGFDIILRPDDTVAQYIADLVVHNREDNSSVTGQAMVNAPLKAFGKNFFQNSTGWAASLDSFQWDELLDSRILCTGEKIDLQALDFDYLPLTLSFNAFYPDYFFDGSNPATLSSKLNRPTALFSLYYEGKPVDMNVVSMGADIKVADYRFQFRDPQPYTLIQVVGDPAMPVAAAGGALMLLGLMLAFYLRPEELWMRLDDEEAILYGRTLKGAAMFCDRAEMILKELKGTS